MTLFQRKQKATRPEVIAWCADQMRVRAESIEAQEVALVAQRAGWLDSEIVWEFLKTQWSVVVAECERHFRGGMADTGTRQLFKDSTAMMAAVESFAPVLFPLTHAEAVDHVREVMANVAIENGWLTH